MLNPVQESIVREMFNVVKSKDENINRLVKSCKNGLNDSESKVYNEEVSELVYELCKMTDSEYNELLNKIFESSESNLFDDYVEGDK